MAGLINLKFLGAINGTMRSYFRVLAKKCMLLFQSLSEGAGFWITFWDSNFKAIFWDSIYKKERILDSDLNLEGPV